MAAVIRNADGRHLLVKEKPRGEIVFNQPAGHLEAGESLIEAIIREVREETCRAFTPEALLGVYRWQIPPHGDTYLRFCFIGRVGEEQPGLTRDPDILDTCWLAPGQLDSPGLDSRSPMVRWCMEDAMAGKAYPLDLLHEMPPPMADRPLDVIVGLSGGVDSSVAALRLVEAGHRVRGLFMKNWEEDDSGEHCSAAEDLADARQVADRLGIELLTVNFSAEYWDRVFAYFLDEYRAGRTPNPDVLCNREIKFKAFLDYALELGADRIATGHYAGVRRSGDSVQLIRAHDENKDQTYFLYMLGQAALRHALFPLHALDKSEVRRIAEQAGFANFRKKDSTGICFIGERRFRDFLARYLPANPGRIETLEGETLGEHQGLMYYTIGQRQGLGIGGTRTHDDRPWFVVQKDLQRNVLLVAQGHDHPALMRQELDAEQLHWVAGTPPAASFRCQARCRHRQPLQDCEVRIAGDTAHVRFDQAQRALTPGQSVVFYQDEVCLGGGIIQ